jgi:hypothetical protein
MAEKANAEKERAAILKRYDVDIERLKKDEEIVHYEITKNQNIKLAETTAFRNIEDANIATHREVDELRITARKFVEKFEIERNKEVEIIDKERLIAVINKSIEEAYAKTEAAEAQGSWPQLKSKSTPRAKSKLPIARRVSKSLTLSPRLSVSASVSQ